MASLRVHYITRQHEYAPGASARVLHQGARAEGADREDCVEWDHANLPGWSQGDPVRYFRAARGARAQNLPHKSPTDARGKSGRTSLRGVALQSAERITPRAATSCRSAFLHAAFGDRYPYVYAIHDPRTVDGMDQAHCHYFVESPRPRWHRTQ